MKLLTKCVGCKEDIKVKSFAKTRPDLERDLGENFSVTCSNCHRKQSKHANEVRAVENLYLPLIGFGMFCLISILLWRFLGAIGTISFGIPIMLYTIESKAVNTFNKYRL